MNFISIQELIGNTDIYLVDQIMKDRYKPNDIILDAGCGGGRNLFWFLKNDFKIYGVDRNAPPIQYLNTTHTEFKEERFKVADVEQLPFGDNFFDHVISSAVLHFAKNTAHFNSMMKEMVRVLKPNGSLFIRITSDIGIENKVTLIEDGVYNIPDGTVRFLLTRSLLNTLVHDLNLSFIDPLKTVNVNDIRCMATLLLKKN